MSHIDEYSLALMSEIDEAGLEPRKLYVEVQGDKTIRYKTLDSTGKEQEGIITKEKAYTKLNWNLLDNNNLDTFKGYIIKSVIINIAIDSGHIPMSRNQKLRRTGLLCVYFVKNYAYHRAGYDKTVSIDQSNFWITTQNNFLDIAILELSKLFGNPSKNKYHWKKIISDRSKLREELREFDYEKIKIYRDKFVAHLDNRTIMNIPSLNDALTLICSLYQDIYSQLEDSHKNNFPENLEKYYRYCLKDAINYYPK